MITDLNKVESNPFQNKAFDICICGAGVAGITLALNLSKKLNIVLLEAGGFSHSINSQEVYKGDIIGREYFNPMETRSRYFGGTSNRWKGMCRPLDYYDFKPKKYVKYSGWPINHNDLEPYLERAKSIVNIPEDTEHTEDIFEQTLSKHTDFKKINFWLSKPITRFGKKYRNEIKAAKNITCYLNANVTNITLSENLSRVKEIKVQNYVEKSFMVNVKTFVLAAGGIENPRIMLNCNHQIKEGLGNSAGLVGRFFTEHLHSTVGGFILEDRFKKKASDNIYLAPSYKFMQKNNILNFGLRIHKRVGHSSDFNFKDKVQWVLCGWSPDIASAIFSSKCSYDEWFCGWSPNIASTILSSKCSYDGFLRMASEQDLNFSSRITLTTKTDKFGMRRVAIDWRLSEIDIQTIKRGITHFGEVFASLGLGRIRLAQWLLSKQPKFPGLADDEVGGHHHMCTTRMGSSPQDGVVDSNQKVFGIDNFYVAGPSVFSTGGHANPVFTIVQMTLRLADYLNKIG